MLTDITIRHFYDVLATFLIKMSIIRKEIPEVLKRKCSSQYKMYSSLRIGKRPNVLKSSRHSIDMDFEWRSKDCS